MFKHICNYNNKHHTFALTSQHPHLQDPIMVETVVKEKLSGDDVTTKPMAIPVFLPETILGHLFGPLNMTIQKEAVLKYWMHAKEFGCPWKDVSPDMDHLPLGLYGDAAKYAPTGEKIIAYFLNVVLWAPKSSRMSRWLLFSLENDHNLGPATLNPLMVPIVESLRKCWNGISFGSTTLKFAVSEIRGDWEWHVLCFDLQRNWRMHSFCWRCDVSKGPGEPNSYWDLSDHPEWAETELTHVQFLARMISPRTSSFLIEVVDHDVKLSMFCFKVVVEELEDFKNEWPLR